MKRYHVAVVLTWSLFVAAVLAAVTDAIRPHLVPGMQSGHATVLMWFFAPILLGATVQAYDSEATSRMADVGATAALALCVTFELPGASVRPGVPAIVAVVALGLVGGGVMASWSADASRSRILARAVPRILTVTALASLFHGRWADRTLIGVVQEQHPIVRASILFAVVYCALILEAPVWAELSDGRTQSRRAAHLSALRESLTLGAVPTSTAVLVAVAQPILGLLALPLLLLPLVFNQLAVRRHEELRRHSRQSVLALSRMPEAMGLVRPGHAARVAALAVDIARELELGRRETAQVERAALLHDLGQVRLTVPVPSGATMLAAPADQEKIAAAGADIAGATDVLEAESVIIRGQSLPYRLHVSHARSIPLGSRIIKVANAFDDLSTGEGTTEDLEEEAALERLYLGLGHEYDPRVVEALAAVLRGGVSRTGDGARHSSTP